jgi:DNA-binding NarL/FixJ family response regulator
LLADDHILFREGLRQILEFQTDMTIVGEASDGIEAVEMAKEYRPDIVLMDVAMPKINGIEATKTIKRECENVNVIILTMHDDDKHIFEAIKEGASGYILKGSSTEKLVGTIKAVLRGESFINSKIALRILSEFSRLTRKLDSDLAMSVDELTLREKEVLDLLARGLVNKQIAKKMSISEKTVKNHVSSIYRKFYCHDRGSVVAKAIKLNLVNVKDFGN